MNPVGAHQASPASPAGRRPAGSGRRRARAVYAAAVGVLAVVFAAALGLRTGIAAGVAGLAVYAAARFACSPPPSDPRRSAYRPAQSPGRKSPMPRKPRVTLVDEFTHTDGCIYRRYQLDGTSRCTDVKVKTLGGAPIYSEKMAEGVAARRLASRRWAHPHLVRR